MRRQIILIFLLYLQSPDGIKATTTTTTVSTTETTSSTTISVSYSTTTSQTTTTGVVNGVNTVVVLNTNYKSCDNAGGQSEATSSPSMTNSSCNEFCANQGSLFSGTMQQ
jgi:hypothetical protein